MPEVVTPYSENNYPRYPNPETDTSTVNSVAPAEPSKVAKRPKAPQPIVESDLNEVSYRVSNLVQHRRAYLGTFYLKFLDLKNIVNFTIAANITCVEIPDMIQTDLHVRVHFEGFSRERPPWYQGHWW